MPLLFKLIDSHLHCFASKLIFFLASKFKTAPHLSISWPRGQAWIRTSSTAPRMPRWQGRQRACPWVRASVSVLESSQECVQMRERQEEMNWSAFKRWLQVQPPRLPTPALSTGRANNTSSSPRILLLAAPRQQLLDAETQMFKNQSPSAAKSDGKERRNLCYIWKNGKAKVEIGWFKQNGTSPMLGVWVTS